MALSMPVVDGKLQNTTADSNSISSNSGKNGKNSLDKDAFLQLLVAQMKYQDPMEPTSNTEYIAQLATFSELEEMQNLRASTDMQRGSGLVGKTVIMESVNPATGNIEPVTGRVDYVVMERGKTYLSINESLYSIDDLKTVLDTPYLEAYRKAIEFKTDMDKLPAVDKITIKDNEEAINKLKETYDKMDDYQKTFIGKELKDLLDSYVKKLKELKELAGDGSEDSDGSGDSGGTGDGSGDTGDSGDEGTTV